MKRNSSKTLLTATKLAPAGKRVASKGPVLPPNKMPFLKISTDLQPELIRTLAVRPNLSKMLDKVLSEVEKKLKTDASSIYIVDETSEGNHKQTATMRAARGYQQYAVGKAKCKILPSEQVANHPTENEKLGLTGWVISTGRSFLAQSPDDLPEHPHWLGKYDTVQISQLGPGKRKKENASKKQVLSLAAFLAVPLRNLRGQVIGALKAERMKGGKVFSVEDQIALEALARVAGRCIAYVADARVGQVNAAITSWTLDVISEAVATESELDDFLDIVVRATAAATQADSCSAFLVDESKKTLTQRAGCGSQVLRRGIRSYKLPNQREGWIRKCEGTPICNPETCLWKKGLPHEKVGVTAWVAATGKSFCAKNKEELRQHCHHLGQFDDKNFEKNRKGQQVCGAWLGVPLVTGGIIIGVLKIENISIVGRPDDRVFTPEIQRRLDVLAQDIALSIQRLQIQNPARYQVIQKAMPIILEILRGGLDVPDLVKKVVTKTAELFNARACALFLKEGNQLIQPEWAAVGWAVEGAKVRRYNLVPSKQIVDTPAVDGQKVGLTVWIAVKKEKFTAKSNLELISHPHHRGTYDKDNFKEKEQCESFMGIPLLLGQEKELVGVLKVETKMKEEKDAKRPKAKKARTEISNEFSYFNEQDELVFELIANSAAIAIQNARLLESRRLADQVLGQPNPARVISELFKFVRGRVEVVNTLESTAQIVDGKDPDKARIVQSFAGLINPTFIPAVLEELANQMDPPLNSLFNYFAVAIRVENLARLREELNRVSTRLPIAALTDRNFFLRESTRFFLDRAEKISVQLEKYEQDPTNRLALQESIRLLEEAGTQLEEMDLFQSSVLGRIFTHWSELFLIALKHFIPVPNPYVAGLPLDPGSPVFVGRKEISRWIQDNLQSQGQKNVLVLHGGWHTGKTSILRQLQGGPLGKHLRERNERPIFPVFVDLQGIPDPGTDSLLLGIAEYAQSDLRERSVICSLPAEAEFRAAPYRAFDVFLKDADRILAQHNRGLLVIMLDEFELLDDRVKSGKIDSEIFNYLRSKMQHQRSVTFILAGRHRLDEMTAEYRNIVFNVALHKEVGFLNVQEAEQLVRAPVKPYAVNYEDRVVVRILELAGGHPYFIQQLCQSCIDLVNQRGHGYDITEELLDNALEISLANNAILENLWEEEVSEEDRKVLMALAQLTKDGRSSATFPELLRHIDLVEDKVSQSLEKLSAQQLILCDQKGGRARRQYRYGIGLFHLWVMRQPI